MRAMRNLTTQLTVMTCLIAGSAMAGASDRRSGYRSTATDDTPATDPLFYVALAGANADDISVPEALASDNLIVMYQHAFGIYPSISSEGDVRNGGVPQRTNMAAHLREITRDINEQIPARDYDGYIAIDYEGWTPFWEDTAGQYKEFSRNLVREAHPGWDDARVERKARTGFEAAAKRLWVRTLDKCHAMRPDAKWGVFGYPRANMRDNEARWFWDRQDVLFPEIYMQYALVPDDVEPELGEAHESMFIMDRLVARVEYAREIAGDRPVLPFIWPRYRKTNPNQWLRYQPLKQSDLVMCLEGPFSHGADAVVIWENIPQPGIAEVIQGQFDDSIAPELRRILEERGMPIDDQLANADNTDDTEPDDAVENDPPANTQTTATPSGSRSGIDRYTRQSRGGG